MENGLTIREKSGQEFTNSSVWYHAAASRKMRERPQQRKQQRQISTPLPQASRRRRFFQDKNSDSKPKTAPKKSHRSPKLRSTPTSRAKSAKAAKAASGAVNNGKTDSSITDTDSSTRSDASDADAWMELWDPGYQHTYYFNRWTGESRWQAPPGFQATAQEGGKQAEG
jgi:hypothetical protein